MRTAANDGSSRHERLLRLASPTASAPTAVAAVTALQAGLRPARFRKLFEFLPSPPTHREQRAWDAHGRMRRAEMPASKPRSRSS